MGLRDKNIDWVRQREYIPVTQMTGWLTYATSGVSTEGSGILAEFNDSGTALNVIAAQMAGDDDIHHHMMFPSYWDIYEDIGVRFVWSFDADMSSSGGAAVWTAQYQQYDQGEQMLAGESSLTALSTAIGAQSLAANLVAGTVLVTSRGIINRNTFDEPALDGMLHWRFTLTSRAGDLADDEPFFLGVWFDYVPRMTRGGPNTSLEDRVT